MCLLQFICSLVRTDECKHIDLSGFHQHSYSIPAAAINHVNHTWRKAGSKSFKQWAYQQHSIFSRLEHYCIAHNQCRKKCSKCFVERIVVRPHAKGNSKWNPPDLSHDPLLLHKIG